MQNRRVEPGVMCIRKQVMVPFRVCERCMYFARFDHDDGGQICSIVCEWRKVETKSPTPPGQPMLTGLVPGPEEELIEDTKDGR